MDRSIHSIDRVLHFKCHQTFQDFFHSAPQVALRLSGRRWSGTRSGRLERWLASSPCSGVFYIPEGLGEVYTAMRLFNIRAMFRSRRRFKSFFCTISFFLFLIVTLKCGIKRLLEHGTESFAPLWFKANEFLSRLHLSSFDSVEVCQNNLSLKCDCSSSENVLLLF